MAHFKEGSKHCQKDVSFLPHSKIADVYGGKKKWYWREVCRNVLLTVHEVIMTQFCLCKCLLGLAISPPLLLSPSIYYQGAHSTKFPHYLLLGLENLFSILGSYYDEDNKGVYQQFLPMERSLKKAGKITLKALPWSQANMLSPVTKRIGSV